jgi:hypothetical protein
VDITRLYSPASTCRPMDLYVRVATGQKRGGGKDGSIKHFGECEIGVSPRQRTAARDRIYEYIHSNFPYVPMVYVLTKTLYPCLTPPFISLIPRSIHRGLRVDAPRRTGFGILMMGHLAQVHEADGQPLRIAGIDGMGKLHKAQEPMCIRSYNFHAS